MKITSREVKQFVIDAGADRCGIASAMNFTGAPEGFRRQCLYLTGNN